MKTVLSLKPKSVAKSFTKKEVIGKAHFYMATKYAFLHCKGFSGLFYHVGQLIMQESSQKWEKHF